MGIFGGKKARAAALAEPEAYVAPSWRAEPGLLIHPSEVVDDQGCASSEVYGIRFLLDNNAEVSLIVWVYPSYAAGDDDDLFEPGYCTEYRAGEWTWKQYALGPGWSCGGLAAATEAARVHAESLAGTAHQSGGEADFLGFDWDGTPW